LRLRRAAVHARDLRLPGREPAAARRRCLTGRVPVSGPATRRSDDQAHVDDLDRPRPARRLLLRACQSQASALRGAGQRGDRVQRGEAPRRPHVRPTHTGDEAPPALALSGAPVQGGYATSSSASACRYTTIGSVWTSSPTSCAARRAQCVASSGVSASDPTGQQAPDSRALRPFDLLGRAAHASGHAAPQGRANGLADVPPVRSRRLAGPARRVLTAHTPASGGSRNAWNSVALAALLPFHKERRDAGPIAAPTPAWSSPSANVCRTSSGIAARRATRASSARSKVGARRDDVPVHPRQGSTLASTAHSSVHVAYRSRLWLLSSLLDASAKPVSRRAAPRARKARSHPIGPPRSSRTW
jgi:hypothetical protein